MITSMYLLEEETYSNKVELDKVFVTGTLHPKIFVDVEERPPTLRDVM